MNHSDQLSGRRPDASGRGSERKTGPAQAGPMEPYPKSISELLGHPVGIIKLKLNLDFLAFLQVDGSGGLGISRPVERHWCASGRSPRRDVIGPLVVESSHEVDRRCCQAGESDRLLICVGRLEAM